MADVEDEVPCQVLSVGKPQRLFFAGPEHAARAFVEANFPRMHVDPGSVVVNPRADVVLVLSDGSQEEFRGREEDEPWQKVVED